MIKLIRELLLSNDYIRSFTSKDVKNAIFHEFKPKLDINNYIILKDKPLKLSHNREYQVSIYMYSKDLKDLLRLEEEVISILNDYKGVKLLLNESLYIKDSTMLTGGGRRYDSKNNRFISVQYYKITI